VDPELLAGKVGRSLSQHPEGLSEEALAEETGLTPAQSELGVLWQELGRSAVIRLVGAVLAEQSDEWAEQRRYMGPEILGRCRVHLIEGETGSDLTPTSLTA